MISKETSTHLLARLMGLSYYPRDNRAAEDDLVLALKAAHNDAIAMVVVNDWIAEQTECPKPAHLRTMIWNENHRQFPEPEREVVVERIHCSDCQGSGIRESTDAADLHSFASRCSCEAGRRVSDRWIDRVNGVRQKLLKRKIDVNPLKDERRSNRIRDCREVYNGEF